MLDIRTEGRVRVVTLNRPEARNAVNPALARALFAAFRDFDSDPTVDTAILTGAGGQFCAGFDLKTVGAEGGDWLDAVAIPPGWSDPVTQPIPGPMGPSRLMLSKPVIAAIEGFAVAGGLELALWCDLRVVATDATFGVFCRRWGVPLIDGGTIRLPRIIGHGRAMDMILTGRAVEAEEALVFGLIDRLHPAGTAREKAEQLALEISAMPQMCMRADRLSANTQWNASSMAAALREEAVGGASPLRREGLAGAAKFAGGAGRGGKFGE